jgi:hypothetical protein
VGAGGLIVVSRDRNFSNWKKWHQKRRWKRHGWANKYGGCWVLWLLCASGYICAVVVEGACVRDCRGLGMSMVGTVGCSAGKGSV